MEDSCGFLGILSLSVCCKAVGYERLPPVRVQRRLTLHFLPPVYSKRRLRSSQAPGSARARRGNGHKKQHWWENWGRERAREGERGGATPVNPTVAKTLGPERGRRDLPTQNHNNFLALWISGGQSLLSRWEMFTAKHGNKITTKTHTLLMLSPFYRAAVVCWTLLPASTDATARPSWPRLLLTDSWNNFSLCKDDDLVLMWGPVWDQLVLRVSSMACPCCLCFLVLVCPPPLPCDCCCEIQSVHCPCPCACYMLYGAPCLPTWPQAGFTVKWPYCQGSICIYY